MNRTQRRNEVVLIGGGLTASADEQPLQSAPPVYE